MKNEELLLFLEQFHMYLSAGLNMDNAMTLLQDSTQMKSRKVIERICNDIKAGVKTGISLEKNADISSHLAGIISHGESVGNMVESIKSVIEIMKRENTLKSKILSAMYYPIIIGIVAVLITFGLMRFVVPSMIPMLNGMNAELPMITKIVMNISNFIGQYFIWIISGMFGIVITTIFVYKKTEWAKRYYDYLLDIVPILNENIRNYYLSISIRSFGLMISSGIRIDVAYDQIREKVGFEPVKRIFIQNSQNIHNGVSLGSIFINNKIPQFIPALIRVGEKTGKLGECLIRSADILDELLEKRLAKLTSMVEPIMMIGIGTVVGTIALSIMLPIYDISKVLQNVK